MIIYCRKEEWEDVSALLIKQGCKWEEDESEYNSRPWYFPCYLYVDMHNIIGWSAADNNDHTLHEISADVFLKYFPIDNSSIYCKTEAELFFIVNLFKSMGYEWEFHETSPYIIMLIERLPLYLQVTKGYLTWDHSAIYQKIINGDAIIRRLKLKKINESSLQENS